MSNVFDRLGRRLSPVDAAWLSVPAGVLVAAGILGVAPLPGDAAVMLAITAVCVCLWIGTPIPPWLTGIVGLGLMGALFSTELALFGFRSPATWLILLGVLIGEATRQSGLATLVERSVLVGMPARAGADALAAYRYLLAAFSLIAAVFVLLIPSALVRVLILGPILVSAGERFAERRARIGLFLGPLFVTFYGGLGVFTGSLSNIIIADIVASATGVSVGWVEWLVWMGPVMTVGRSIAIVAVAYLLYRPTDADAIEPDAATPEATEGNGDRRMLAFLLVGVVIWATDAIHGLHPLYGALVVTVLLFLPRIGVVGPDAVADADFSVVFYLGAIFAIAEGLQRTDFTDIAAGTALSAVPPDAPFPLLLGAVAIITMAVTFVMEGLATASVLTPLIVSFAADAGIPVLPVAMIEAVSLVTYFFPYQSAVLVGMLSLDMADSRELVRMAAVCSAVTLLLLVPIQIGVFVVAF